MYQRSYCPKLKRAIGRLLQLRLFLYEKVRSHYNGYLRFQLDALYAEQNASNGVKEIQAWT